MISTPLSLYKSMFSMQRRRTDISLIFFFYYSESAQPDIYISSKLMWHHQLCSLVKGQRSKSAHKDGLKSYVNCRKIIQFPSYLTTMEKLCSTCP